MFSRAIAEAKRRIGSLMAGRPYGWHNWTYSEKLAWRCLNPDPKLDYDQWVNKFRVKETVAGHFDVPKTYQIVTEPTDICTENLPKTYVMKATNGWNKSLLVEDGITMGGNRDNEKAGHKADAEFLQAVANEWFSSKRERKRQERELLYQQVKRGILFEEYLDPIDHELQLFLFDGRCEFGMTLFRAFDHTKSTKYQNFDRDWNNIGSGTEEFEKYYENSKAVLIPPPPELLANLRILCKGIDHVRADFLFHGGKYYFSEFTFTHNGGNGPGFIGKFDAELGLSWMP